jgi:hypothetical protein
MKQMNNKYEKRIRKVNKIETPTQERRRLQVIGIYDSLPKETIKGEEYVALKRIVEQMLDDCSLATANRAISSVRSCFKSIKVGKACYLQYIGEPVEPDKKITKSSAITTVATVLADIANIQDTLSSMTDFYETLDVEYEQVIQLNAMVRDTVLELANQADALAFTISEE